MNATGFFFLIRESISVEISGIPGETPKDFLEDLLKKCKTGRISEEIVGEISGLTPRGIFESLIGFLNKFMESF